MKIKFVQLESQAFLTDLDFITMSAAERGVFWHKQHRKWVARIQYKGRTFHLGCYDCEANAAVACDDKAIELFGEFACLNFHCRPEIRLWVQTTYLFPPACSQVASETGPDDLVIRPKTGLVALPIAVQP